MRAVTGVTDRPGGAAQSGSKGVPGLWPMSDRDRHNERGAAPPKCSAAFAGADWASAVCAESIRPATIQAERMVLVNMAVSFARVAAIVLLRWNSLALRVGGHARRMPILPGSSPLRRAGGSTHPLAHAAQTAKAPDERPIRLHQRHTRDDSAGAFAYLVSDHGDSDHISAGRRQFCVAPGESWTADIRCWARFVVYQHGQPSVLVRDRIRYCLAG